MPDLSPYRGYLRAMNALERRYTGSLLRSLRTYRPQLYERTIELGVTNPGFPLAVESILNQLRIEAREINDTAGEQLLEQVRQYNGRQLAILRRFVPETPRLPQIRTEVDEAGILAETFGRSNWIDGFQALILSTSRLLRNESSEVTARRLFGASFADGRATIYRNTVNSMNQEAALSIWGAGNQITDSIFVQVQERVRPEIKRQAIAAIDERTTDCCLWVHGQIVGMRERFKLRGTPRFADEMMDPPFHWNCRTSVALYMPEFESLGVTTQEMNEAASAEMIARERAPQRRREIHPAHATSGR